VSGPTYVHRFAAGTGAAGSTLVLLHGSEGTDADLLPLADELAPGAAKLAVRGSVPIGGGFAFFRRFPDRRLDEGDLAARVPVLATFIETARKRYQLTRRPVVVGFSNGAIMAAALLMRRPGLLAGAILFRPLSPFAQEGGDRLDGTPVLIADGADDRRRSPGDGLLVAERLSRLGARVTHRVLPVDDRCRTALGCSTRAPGARGPAIPSHGESAERDSSTRCTGRDSGYVSRSQRSSSSRMSQRRSHAVGAS